MRSGHSPVVPLLVTFTEQVVLDVGYTWRTALVDPSSQENDCGALPPVATATTSAHGASPGDPSLDGKAQSWAPASFGRPASAGALGAQRTPTPPTV
jgi:hypothetical protein